MNDLDDVAELLGNLPQVKSLGLSVEGLSREEAIMRLPANPALVGNPAEGFLHPGAITTLIDTVAAMAVFARIPAGRMIATLDLRIDYMGPALADRPLIGRATCYRVGGDVAFARGQAYEEAGDDRSYTREIATFSGAFMMTDPLPKSVAKAGLS